MGRRYSEIGWQPGQDAAARERVALINVATLLALFVAVLALPGTGRTGSSLGDAMTFVAIFFEGTILVLNMSGFFRTARFLFLVANQAMLIVSAAANTSDMNLHLLFFPHFVYPEILFGRNEKLAARLFLALPVSLFFLVELGNPPWLGDLASNPERVHAISKLMAFSVTIYLIVAIRFLGRIREVYEIEDANHRARFLMNAKMAALGEMAGGMAHEINNPLAIISGKADQISRMGSTGEMSAVEVSQGAQVIQKHADRIAAIVRGLRSFARDGEEDPFSEASASQILLETLALCRARFASQGIELRVTGIDTQSLFQCRPVQIEQVLVNLLNNSLDALGTSSEKWVELAFQEGKHGIEISVTDSGPGIPRDIEHKILLPFFTTKPVGKGTGLGLSISSGIARAHGGELYLDKASARTRFVLSLPKHQPSV